MAQLLARLGVAFPHLVLYPLIVGGQQAAALRQTLRAQLLADVAARISRFNAPAVAAAAAFAAAVGSPTASEGGFSGQLDQGLHFSSCR